MWEKRVRRVMEYTTVNVRVKAVGIDQPIWSWVTKETLETSLPPWKHDRDICGSVAGQLFNEKAKHSGGWSRLVPIWRIPSHDGLDEGQNAPCRMRNSEPFSSHLDPQPSRDPK